jgi:hypothetical protein
MSLQRVSWGLLLMRPSHALFDLSVGIARVQIWQTAEPQARL